MKTFRLGVVVGVVVLGSGSPGFGQVDVNYDGVQTVFSMAPQSGRNFDVSAAFACPGEEACRPLVVRVVFATFSRKVPKYDDNHSVSVVIDGETRLSVPNARYAVRRAAANQVYESIVCMIDIDDFVALANAKKAEYAIGSKEGELSDKQLRGLTALAAKLPETEDPPKPEAGEAGGSEPD